MSEPTVRKVVLAAGGTGGHMFPAESLARELTGRGIEVVLVTDRRGSGFAGDLDRVETHRIRAGGIAGGSVAKRLGGLFELAIGLLQARRLIARLNADAVVGFGGYASVPTVLAGSWAGLRVVLHEQNAVAGRANRLLAGRAHAIATSFAHVGGLGEPDQRKVRQTGNPVRPEVTAAGERPYAPPHAEDEVHLLVTGGSQGATVFNDVVPAAVAQLPEALRRRLVITQQVRGDVLAAVEEAYRASGVRAELAGFFDDVPRRLAEAQLVICRAGASTVAELAGAGRPAVLVPYPHAVDDHQRANAEALAVAGAAWVMPQHTLDADALAVKLRTLIANPEVLTSAARSAAGFAPREAAQSLADLVCGAANDNGDHEGRNRREAAA
jgi:UDP-N-acetylglucosamine--N-acetylmuramyl-(pentapeptide) pyrophosphoryl-undecaprenol N-acetylglucosamine transferase